MLLILGCESGTGESNAVTMNHADDTMFAPVLIDGSSDMTKPHGAVNVHGEGPAGGGRPTDAGLRPIDATSTAIDADVSRPVNTETCNGSRHLCDRPFNEVAFLTTHNAMSSAARNWLFPNQTHAMPKQLADGVRGLMLDVYDREGIVTLCHGDCRAGHQPLADGLTEIRDFLAMSPSNVITLIFESYVDPKALRDVFDVVQLGDELFEFDSNDSWPTLGQMIANKQRLVVLSDVRPVDHTEIMYVWDVAWETHYRAQSIDDFTCEPNRGVPTHPLFILNHFLTDPVASKPLAVSANSPPFFLERTMMCMNEADQKPNFVTVDFYEVGEGRNVVDSLNEL